MQIKLGRPPRQFTKARDWHIFCDFLAGLRLRLFFGEKYTAYQIPSSKFPNTSKAEYEKKVELLGDYHEDYERVLVFASNIIGETIDELQNNIMKIEVDSLQAIEKEGIIN